MFCFLGWLGEKVCRTEKEGDWSSKGVLQKGTEEGGCSLLEAKQLLFERNHSGLTISHLRFFTFTAILCLLLIFGCLFWLSNALSLLLISVCLVSVSSAWVAWRLCFSVIQRSWGEVGAGKHVLRVISVYLESIVVDEVRTRAYHQLFHPEQLINSKEDAVNNPVRCRLWYPPWFAGYWEFTFTNLNRFVVQITSSLMTPLCLNGALTVDMIEFQTNPILYPRIHFMLSSYALFIFTGKAYHE